MGASKKSTYDGLALRAAAQQRLAGQTDPKEEAERHERFFLSQMSGAREHFDWIVANQAWTVLGFETFASWWEARVAPVAAGLGMRPTREIAQTVIDKVREDEAALPRAQRRTQQQLAEMVGMDRSALSGRDGSRSLPRENTRQSDLEEPPADAAIAAMHDALQHLDDHLSRPASQPGDAADDSSTDGDGDETEPEVSGAPSSEDTSGSVDARERAGSGVTQPAPAPAIPNWLRAVTAVCAAVHDLAEEDAASVAGVMDHDLAAELGLATSRLLAWHKSMQEAVNGAIDE